MRTNLPFILHRRSLNVDESGTEIALAWQTWPAGTTFDPTTQSYVADDDHQPTAQTGTLKAFIHFVNFLNSQVRQFNEIEVGDVILDVAPDTDLSGREGLTFTIDGQDYVPKPLSNRLAQAMDVIFQGEKILRPLLLRRKT